MTINEHELEIFSRQLILSEFDIKNFNRLQNKTISIVGVGGIGCAVAQYLIACGTKHLNLFDNDIIKKNNLNRQTLYSLNELGKKKTTIAKKKLLSMNSEANINSYNSKITKDNLDLLKNSSIIIDTSDNWETMKLINRYSSEKNLPLISASAIGFHIQILLFENKKNKHLCLECVFPNQKEPKLPRCDTVGILGTVAGLAGLISAQKTINYIMDFGQPTNLMTIVDCKSLSFNHIRINEKTDCKLKNIKK